MSASTSKPDIDYDRVYLDGPFIGQTVRQMLLASYKVESCGCWRWTRGFFSSGYGQFGYNPVRGGKGIRFQAHRAFAEMLGGLDIRGQFVLHSCDNPWCVNPDHLRLGTPQDNMDDKMSRGRGNIPKGQDRWNRVLTDEGVLDIRRRAPVVKYKVLAEEYGVKIAAVCNIVKGVSWRHLPLHPTPLDTAHGI